METVGKLKNNNIVLMGDFNARTKNLDDTLLEEKHEDFPIQDFFSSIFSKRSNQDHSTNNYGKKLIEYCIATLSYIANGRTLGDFEGKFTCHQHNGSSTVDYAIIKERMKHYVRRFQVLEPNIGSDHCPIILELISDRNEHLTKTTLIERPPPIIWNDKTRLKFINKMNSEEANKKILEIKNLIDCDNDNLEKIVEEIVNIYDTSDMKNPNGNYKTKKKGKKRKSNKWYDQSCSDLSKRLTRTAKSLAGSPNNPHMRANFIKTKKAYRKLVKTKKREWKKHMIQKLEEIEEKDPKEYWKLINELREKKSSDTQYDAEKFTLFFEELFSPSEKERNDEIKSQITELLEQLPNLPEEPDFTLEELIKAIKSLKNNKAAGPDRIPAEMLKASNARMLKLLLSLMNKIKTTCKCPRKWAIGITTLLLKDGDDTDPNNFRAITIVDALCKVLAIMINGRLEKWSTENKVQRKEQIGFTKKTRPADHLFVLKTLVHHYNNNGKKTICMLC